MLSARRATIPQNRAQRRQQFLYTPSARRATDDNRPQTLVAEISIHALREEGDPEGGVRTCLRSKFLFTPSARRATISQ